MAYSDPTILTAGTDMLVAQYNILAENDKVFRPFVGGKFTNEAARDSDITSPTEGMHAYLTAPTVPTATGAYTAIPGAVQTIYNGSVWVCVTPVGAGSNTDATTTSTTSTPAATTLTSDTTAVSVTLVTGATARLDISAVVFNSTAGQFVYMGWIISGATTRAYDLEFDAHKEGTPVGAISRSLIVTGLTDGTNTFTLAYRVNANTGTFRSRDIIVTGVA